MPVKDFLREKAEMIVILSTAIIADLIPMLVIFVALWVIQHAAKFFGFGNLIPIKIISFFSEIFMVILYLFSVYLSYQAFYKLYKDGKV